MDTKLRSGLERNSRGKALENSGKTWQEKGRSQNFVPLQFLESLMSRRILKG